MGAGEDFEVILEEIWGSGKYQKRLTLVLLGNLFFLMPFALLVQMFVLHIPDHWCTPPEEISPELFNITLDQWKETFLPMELGPDYQPRPSQCSMYKVDNETVQEFLSGTKPGNYSGLETVFCKDLSGYDYDQSEMMSTAVTDNDWVCEYAERATFLFTFGVCGIVAGVLVFSTIADYFGRKLVFFICVALMIALSVVTIFISDNFPAFVALKLITNATMMPLFQSPMAIISEITTSKARGMALGWAFVTWAIGSCALPLIAWLIPYWKTLQVVCTVPMAFVFLCWKITPESPRWLLTKKKVAQADLILRKIAKTNGVQPPEDLMPRLMKIANDTSEVVYGMGSLFTSCRLAWRAVLVSICFTTSSFVYYQLVINIGNMGGNLFLNFFLIALVEGPGSALGFVLANKFGRRWTHAGLLLLNTLLFFSTMWVVYYYPNLTVVVTVFCMLIKFNISATFAVAYFQAMEVFPTCIRQSGIGFCTLISQVISIGGPYVIYLGSYDLRLPYGVMAGVCFIGFVAAVLMPETLYRHLPETIEEASTFGAEDKFFSYLPAKREFLAAKRLKAEKEEGEEKASLRDWNPVLRASFKGSKQPDDVSKELIGDLTAHYVDAPESSITS